MSQAVKVLILIAALLTFAAPAGAYPVLQLYIDGATYDPETESWGTAAPVFDLWVIGDVSKFGTIYEIKLAMAFFGTGGSVTLTPKTTSVVTDPSTPPATSLWSTGTGSNEPLPDHGIYNDPALNHWENHLLGDFTLTDSPIGDFITSFPTEFDSAGQINVYEVSVTGWERVHFDAFDHTVTTTPSGREQVRQWKAPFSHDAHGASVPEPGTLFLLGSGLAGLAGYGWRRRYLPHPLLGGEDRG